MARHPDERGAEMLSEENLSELRRNLAHLSLYKFWITPRWQSQQHRMLVDLGNAGQQVYYAAPIFHLQTDFNTEFQGNTVVNRSAFINPAEIGYLADDDEHCIVFNNTEAYFCSEPLKLRFHTGGSLKDFLVAQMRVLNPTSTLDVASTLNWENALVRLAEGRVRHFRELIEEIRGTSKAGHSGQHGR